MSRKMGDLKKAGAVMDGFFTASESVSESPKKPAKGNAKTETEKPSWLWLVIILAL